MKNFRNFKLLSFLFILGVIATSCVHDDDFNVPDMNVEEPNVNVNTDILSIKALLTGNAPVKIETGEGSNTEMWLAGYVISDDESGNIFKQLFIQDSPENPTAGVVISTNAADLYTKYGPGQKIYFRVDGLYIGKFAGLPSIGIREGNDVGRLGIEDFQERILRSTERAEIVPTVITMNQMNEASRMATLVKFENVQFPSDVAGTAHYGNLNDTFGVNRMVEDCDGNKVIMRTSGFSDFKNMTLPAGNGSLTTILSFFNNDPQLLIRNTEDVQMDGPRCGADDDDGGDPGDAVSLPFSEKFQGLQDYDPISRPGWTNQDVSGSGRKWESRNFGTNGYAQLTAHNATSPVEAWLVTPGLNLTTESAAKLSFKTKDGHYNGEVLSVYISTDFTGNATTATWTQLNNVIISQGHTDNYGDNFISSGEVDLAQYLGQVIYVGFKYQGAEGGIKTTMQLDDVLVSADGTDDGGGDDDGEDPDDPTPGAAFAFAGADFENWADFIGGLNTFGIKGYATQGVGTGMNGSASLKIATSATTTDGNDYVFTAKATSGLPANYNKISFYIKGSSDKSVSFNIYKTDGTFYAFNLGDLTSDSTIAIAENNQYNGSVNTGGQWRLVSLDLSSINDLNVTNIEESFLALKIGKNANYDLNFDNFTIE